MSSRYANALGGSVCGSLGDEEEPFDGRGRELGRQAEEGDVFGSALGAYDAVDEEDGLLGVCWGT